MPRMHASTSVQGSSLEKERPSPLYPVDLLGTNTPKNKIARVFTGKTKKGHYVDCTYEEAAHTKKELPARYRCAQLAADQ